MSSTIDKARAMAQEVAVEDFNKAAILARSAAKSGAYLYPIKGIVYFVTHRDLWKPLLSKLIPTMSLSVAVIAFMFIFTYLPQLAVLVFVNGPLAAFTTILLTLSESSTLITLLSKTFLIQDALVDTFDGVLVAKNEQAVVAQGRQLKAGNFQDPIAKLGKLIKSPFEKFTPTAVIRYVMYLPLNFIPVVGTVIFVLLQGRTRGNSVHTRYFQLKNWSKSQKDAWLKENTAAYTAAGGRRNISLVVQELLTRTLRFGIVAVLLELIPIASILFSFTNTVGAALWAADIESNNTIMTEMSFPKRGGSDKKTE